jgi:hypothetical protein
MRAKQKVVIPAKAGIQYTPAVTGPPLSRG